MREQIKLTNVSQDVYSWVRDIYFDFQNEQQYVQLKWKLGKGYTILDDNFTINFRKELDKWHETTEELFESFLDDLTFQKVGE